jgi:hypothetical protein
VSEHHRRQGWQTFTKQRRAELEAQLPLPCIECGKPVHRDAPTARGMLRPPTSWHVGHITDAAKGGRPTRENTGPVHAKCNLRSGGKAGAAVTNARRTIERGIRPW